MAAEYVSGSPLTEQTSFALPQRMRWRHVNYGIVLALMLAPVFIVWLGTFSSVDLMLADAVFDHVHKRFPWRHAWVTEVFGHVVLKIVLAGIGAFFALSCLHDLVRPLKWSWQHRFHMRVVALSACLVPTVISLMKHFSSSHCPWDLQRYGGTELYIRLLEQLPAGITPGHCLPAGHASSALWMISLAVFLLPYRPYKAALTFAVLLGLGFAVGWMQQLRGAHFLTHTLWSMWIACAIVYGLFILLDRRQEQR